MDLLILQETKVDSNIHCIIRDIWSRRICAWDWVPSMGFSGGLICIWNKEVLLIEDVLKAPRLLAIKVHDISKGFIWAIANVYGPNYETDRPTFLGQMADFKSQWNVPFWRGLQYG